MIEDGLKVGDSFGSDVTKIKYCGLKGLVWSPQSREACTNDLENTSSLRFMKSDNLQRCGSVFFVNWL